LTFCGTTRCKLAAVFLLGLLISQILSFIHVHQSNIAYRDALDAITAAGYLAVPNQKAADGLPTYQAAWNGGLFFTFTIGLCLTFLSCLFAHIFRKLPVKRNLALLLPVSLWLFVVIKANLNGFSSPAFFHFMLIPPVIFYLTTATSASDKPGKRGTPAVFHITVFTAFVIFSASVSDMNIFLDVRDTLLLNSRIGRRINAFYYDNSLYSARVFKSTGQRLLKTCALSPELDDAVSRRIAARLIHRDYLPVADTAFHHDLYINMKGDDLELMKKDHVVMTLPLNDFINEYKTVLREFEAQTDRHGFFRKFTMMSILFNGVLILFLVMYLPLYMPLKRYTHPMKASIVAGVFCLSGSFLFFSMLDVSDPLSNDKLNDALSSPLVNNRIAALKYIYRNRIDYNVLPFYSDITGKENVAERYWFAKNLRYSRDGEAEATLRTLLNDPHFNVVCMAFHALGYVGSGKDVSLIMEKIRQSDNWYEQWYGYKALRRLGWKQGKSG